MKISLSVFSKIWTIVCVLVAVSLSKDIILIGTLALFGFLQLAIQKKYSVIFSYGIFYAVLGILLYAIRFHGFHMIIFSEFYVLLFWNLSPVVLASWDLITTHPGELSSFLSRIHTPTSVILGFLVVFRFFPTAKSELRSVSLSMKNRGMTELGYIIKHPVLSCEYVLIPFLFRVLTTADRLSVSAVARGAETPGIRGSYYESKFRLLDLAAIAVWTILTVVYLQAGGMKI